MLLIVLAILVACLLGGYGFMLSMLERMNNTKIISCPAAPEFCTAGWFRGETHNFPCPHCRGLGYVVQFSQRENR